MPTALNHHSDRGGESDEGMWSAGRAAVMWCEERSRQVSRTGVLGGGVPPSARPSFHRATPWDGTGLGPGISRTARAHDSCGTLRMGKAVALRLQSGALKIGGRKRPIGGIAATGGRAQTAGAEPQRPAQCLGVSLSFQMPHQRGLPYCRTVQCFVPEEGRGSQWIHWGRGT